MTIFFNFVRHEELGVQSFLIIESQSLMPSVNQSQRRILIGQSFGLVSPSRRWFYILTNRSLLLPNDEKLLVTGHLSKFLLEINFLEADLLCMLPITDTDPSTHHQKIQFFHRHLHHQSVPFWHRPHIVIDLGAFRCSSDDLCILTRAQTLISRLLHYSW